MQNRKLDLIPYFYQLVWMLTLILIVFRWRNTELPVFCQYCFTCCLPKPMNFFMHTYKPVSLSCDRIEIEKWKLMLAKNSANNVSTVLYRSLSILSNNFLLLPQPHRWFIISMWSLEMTSPFNHLVISQINHTVQWRNI